MNIWQVSNLKKRLPIALKNLLKPGTNNKKMFTSVFRLVVGIVLGYGLIHFTLKSTGGDLWNEVVQARSSLLLLALLFYGVILCLTIYRWNLLLRVQEVRLRAWDLIRLTMIGVFFNLAIPGAVGGDLLKMGLVANQAKDKKAEAVLTIMVDRALGILGLFIVASVMLLIYLPFLLGLSQEYRLIQIAAFTVGLGSLGGVFVITLVELRQTITRFPLIARIINYGARKLPSSFVSTLARLVNALELYRRNRGTIVGAIALSVLVHSCLAIDLFIVGASVGEDILGLGDYFVAAQVANAVAAIPVTPAGIGARDAIIGMFFSAMKARAGKSGIVPVTMTLIIVFWGLIGGVIFGFSKSPNRKMKIEP
jgi:uncharacterized protein (TIRG00374 family)